MRKTLLTYLLLLPLSAVAADECRHSALRDLTLDLGGVHNVVFEVGPHDLKLDAAPNANGALHGRACASSAELLDTLLLSQHKDGDTLVVTMARRETGGSRLFQSRYARLQIKGSLPDNLALRVRVGSGDAEVSGAASLDATVGSGDLQARRIAGAVTAVVGSGDLRFERIGSLDVGSVGSGDLVANRIGGDARIGSIGSGDAELREVGGNVDVGSVGSGDLDVRDVRGNLRVRTIGSGDVDHRGVEGTLDLPGRSRSAQSHTISVDNPENNLVHVQGNRVGANAGDGRIAWIDRNGALRIDGKPVAMNAQQQALARQYHAGAMALHTESRAVARAGAAFASKTVWSVMAGLVTGNTDAIEDRVDRHVARFGASLVPLCQRIASLKTAQDALARAVPEFSPYATITQASATECTSEVNELSA